MQEFLCMIIRIILAYNQILVWLKHLKTIVLQEEQEATGDPVTYYGKLAFIVHINVVSPMDTLYNNSGNKTLWGTSKKMHQTK